MFAVAGVTGHTGRVVAETLLSRGKPVRVLVREEAKGAPWRGKGAEVRVASLDDSSALARALEGARGAYLLVPPRYDVEDAIGTMTRTARSIAAGVKSSGIPHVVALSSLGASRSAGTGPIQALHRFEEALGDAAPNRTFLRAAYFIENMGAVMGEVQRAHVFPTFLTPGKEVAMVATVDIGRVAASLLLDPAEGTRIVDLLGPTDHTPESIAAILSRVMGSEIKMLPVPLEQVVPIFTSLGISKGGAELFHQLFQAINAGNVGPTGVPAATMRGATEAEEVLGSMLQHTPA